MAKSQKNSHHSIRIPVITFRVVTWIPALPLGANLSMCSGIVSGQLSPSIYTLYIKGLTLAASGGDVYIFPLGNFFGDVILYLFLLARLHT